MKEIMKDFFQGKVFRLLVTGLPGSGKSVLSEKISKALNIDYIKVGAILRQIAKSQEDQGLGVKESLEKGELVDDNLVGMIVRKQVSKTTRGFVIDGYPRKVEQLSVFDPEFDKVFWLEVPVEELKRRLLARGRADDTKELIEKRFEVQRTELMMVLEYFESAGKLCRINGDQEIERVFEEIMGNLS